MPTPATAAATDKITTALAVASQAILDAIAGLRDLHAAQRETDDRLAHLDTRLARVESYLQRRADGTE